jgi:hypothetical protein
MKAATAVLLFVLFVAPHAMAQETPQQAALVKNGRIKMWTGIALIGTGAFVLLPIATKGEDSSWSAPGAALVFTGGSLIWFGYRDQHKALGPSTTFGVVVGKKTSFHLRHVW